MKDAMAGCVFPEDIMLGILTRLPVKSLLRFKSVCKPWCKLFATPEFMKTHHHQFSSDPENQDFIICNVSWFSEPTMSLFSIEFNAKKPTNFDLPYPKNIVGCCNGLLCIDCSLLGHEGIVLWNPALKLSKFVPLSKVDFGVPEMVSFGFGYDAEGDDFKVIRILCLKGEEMRVGVEVYSAKSDSWRTIEAGFQFKLFWIKNDAIVNGNPYWFAKVQENEGVKSRHHGWYLVWFDVKKLEFKMLPLPEEALWWPVLVDWKGSLAATMYRCNKDRECVRVWVFDGDEMIWRLNHTFRPVEMKMDERLQFLKNGKIIGKRVDGKVCLFDPVTGLVKVIEIEEAPNWRLEIYAYSESLAYIKGMEPVKVKKRTRGGK